MLLINCISQDTDRRGKPGACEQGKKVSYNEDFIVTGVTVE